MSLLGIATPVVIREIRSGSNLRFAAVVTSVDASAGRHYVTKFNANGSNRAGPAMEVIAKALRFDDGRPPEDGEDYVIEEVKGLSAQMAQDITNACKQSQTLKEDIDALRKEALDRDMVQDRRLASVIDTLMQFAPEDTREAVKQSMASSVFVSAPPIDRTPKKPEPVQDADGFDAPASAVAVETKKRK